MVMEIFIFIFTFLYCLFSEIFFFVVDKNPIFKTNWILSWFRFTPQKSTALNLTVSCNTNTKKNLTETKHTASIFFIDRDNIKKNRIQAVKTQISITQKRLFLYRLLYDKIVGVNINKLGDLFDIVLHNLFIYSI